MKNQPGQKIPNHIAIIMDGNRRWARERGLPPVAGHKKVADDVLEPLVEHAYNRGVHFITFWAFSTENWRRDPAEVSGIMGIFREAIGTFGKRMHEKGIRIRYIGDLSKFQQDIRTSVTDLVELTRKNTRITVVFALNYGGRDSIVRAINTCTPPVTQEVFSRHLDTGGIPDPDIIIRTGGEQRLSGFLLWESEYSELFFPSWYMPDFTPEKLDEIIEEYNTRERRYGK